MNGHPTREEDFDLYALGALEDDDRQAMESHVASCAECARKLAEARGRIAMLALAAPPVEPPSGAKQRLLARARAAVASTAPPVRTPRASGYDAIPAAYGRWFAAVLAPVCLALAIAAVFLWVQNERIGRDLALLRETVTQERQSLIEAQHANDLLAARDTIVVPLAPMPGMPKAMGRVTYSKNMGMLMYDGTAEPAPAGKSYQLWVVPMHGEPINAGVFNPSSGEISHWMMKLPEGVTPRAFAVTLEPAGGMPHPTGPKVLAGAVS